MNRELKFRAWGRINKHMYPVAFPSWNGTVEGKIDLVSHEVEEIDQDGDDTPVVMQFTGLYDKNGTEIFEGDVVDIKRRDDPNIYQVVVKDIRFLPEDFFGSGFEWSEVIGNIFANPELLECP